MRRLLLLLMLLLPVGCTDTQVCSWLMDHGHHYLKINDKEWVCFRTPTVYNPDGTVQKPTGGR